MIVLFENIDEYTKKFLESIIKFGKLFRFKDSTEKKARKSHIKLPFIISI